MDNWWKLIKMWQFQIELTRIESFSFFLSSIFIVSLHYMCALFQKFIRWIVNNSVSDLFWIVHLMGCSSQENELSIWLDCSWKTKTHWGILTMYNHLNRKYVVDGFSSLDISSNNSISKAYAFHILSFSFSVSQLLFFQSSIIVIIHTHKIHSVIWRGDSLNKQLFSNGK